MFKTDQSNYIRRLKRGKEDALEFIVDLYLPLVKGIASKVLRPLAADGLIEECINEIFFSVWQHAQQFSGEDPEDFRKWLCGVSRYRAIDFYRKEKKKQAVLAEALALDELSGDAAVSSGGQSAEDELLIQEDRSGLLELLDELPAPDREIFILKFFMGMKSEEISQQLGLSKSSVDNRIYRGKKKLLPIAVSAGYGHAEGGNTK